jgi:hypothetical protein
MQNNKERSVVQKLSNLLETRIDVPAFLQELLLEGDTRSRVSRRSFGTTPAIIGPIRAVSRTGARVLPFPVAEPKSPKAV